MPLKSLAEIKAEVEAKAESVRAPDDFLPTYGHSDDGARPHIEVDSRGYHFVIVERGCEQSRFATQKFEELLYRVFQNITSAMAISYELVHRNPHQDCRRIVFAKQVELLSRLSREWAAKEAREHEKILQKHPFQDTIAAAATNQVEEE